MSPWCGDLELRLSSYQIDGRGKRAVRAVIRYLGGEINRNAKGHAQDIQEPQERMSPQMPKNVPAKDAKILCFHVEFEFSSRFPRPQSEEVTAGVIRICGG